MPRLAPGSASLNDRRTGPAFAAGEPEPYASVESAGCSATGCSVVSGACSSRARASVSLQAAPGADVGERLDEHRRGSAASTQRGAVTRRERRSTPRSIASIATFRGTVPGGTVRLRPTPTGRDLLRGARLEAAFDHVGVDEREIRDTDARTGVVQLGAQRVAESLDGGLGGVVGTKHRRVYGGGKRGDRQRVTTRMGDMRAGGTQRVVDTEQIDCDRALKDRGVATDQRQRRGDTGVGDDDVESAEALDGTLDGALDLEAIGDVALKPRRVAALACDLREQLGSRPASARRAPRACSRRAVSAPIPRAAPVTKTRRPSRGMVLLLISRSGDGAAAGLR